MAGSNNANVFVSKASRYSGNIAGTNAYWNRVREELKAIITSVGAPTIFFTFPLQICIDLNCMPYSMQVLTVILLTHPVM